MKKNSLLPFLLLFISSAAMATDEPKAVLTQLRSAVVFRNGAELSHTATVQFVAGTSEVMLEGIGNDIDLNSLQVNCPAHVTLLGVEFSQNHLVSSGSDARLRIMLDSADALQRELEKVQSRIQTTNDLIEVLKANRDIKGSEAGLSVAELARLMDYYARKSAELQDELAALNVRHKKLAGMVSKIRAQIKEEESKNTRVAGRLHLRVISTSNARGEVTVTYFTPHASWAPFYDIRVESTSRPMKLAYKARIVQTTGIDWKQVKMSLSTSSPTQSGNAPVLNSWFLTYIDPVKRINNRLAKNTIPSMAPAMEKAEETDEYEAPLPDFVSVRESALNLNFDLAVPYDVPTNGKEQSATLQEHAVPSFFKYYAVPRLDKDPYLLAEVSEWEKLNLLPGEANIIFEGTYIGKSVIDPNSTLDTLNLTLGKDKRVTIKKEKLADFSSVSIFGSNKVQKLSYELSVKNNKKDTVQMLLKDQYPLSTSNDIDVTLLEDSGASVNRELGVLTWKLQLAPGEVKKLRFAYQVRYPKDKMINLN